VTDGDIRRWILKGRGLEDDLSKVMHRDPIYMSEGYSMEEARRIMVSHKLECVPVVSAGKVVVSALWWLDLFTEEVEVGKKIDLPVVIMAGGKGSRLYPFTHILPKPLMLVGEKPVIEMIIDKFARYGCGKFYLSINYKSSIIKAYFNDIDREYSVQYIEEKSPLGTAGSLHMLKSKIRSRFFLSNCDVVIDADYSDILQFHNANRNKITLVCSMKHYTIPYGVCRISNGGTLKSISEKPEYDFLVNSGLYLLDADTLNDIPKNKPYHITDLINSYLKKHKKIGVYPISERSWVDIGHGQTAVPECPNHENL
jgi:NDP-sugar pyrophosphorylase family protein